MAPGPQTSQQSRAAETTTSIRGRPATTRAPAPPPPANSWAEVDEFERLYLKARSTLAEALSRATTDAAQRMWQARIAGISGFHQALNRADPTEVLRAISVMHAAQQAAVAAIATQLAISDIGSHR